MTECENRCFIRTDSAFLWKDSKMIFTYIMAVNQHGRMSRSNRDQMNELQISRLLVSPGNGSSGDALKKLVAD
jgi:hypothetical protein